MNRCVNCASALFLQCLSLFQFFSNYILAKNKLSYNKNKKDIIYLFCSFYIVVILFFFVLCCVVLCCVVLCCVVLCCVVLCCVVLCCVVLCRYIKPNRQWYSYDIQRWKYNHHVRHRTFHQHEPLWVSQEAYLVDDGIDPEESCY
jgi:hypothetical protein